jgi:hypothetical protein
MRTEKLGIVAIFVLGLAMTGSRGLAQPADIFSQLRDGATAQPLSAEDKAKLQDPFFRLVLARQPDVTKLADVENLIQPDLAARRLFVVDEEIKDPRQGQSRRAVIDFVGVNAGIRLEAAVMLSVFFESDSVPEVVDIEAWGFDKANGIFNYYKLDKTGHTPPRLSWKLRASSADTDRLGLTAAARAGTCLRCHTSGVPVMKELLAPWNNWQSGFSDNAYLTKLGPPAERWPVVNDPHLSRLTDAYSLEAAIKSAITQFTNRKLDRVVIADEQGGFNVQDAKGLLRPLLETTEVNLASAQQRSGLHPLAPGGQTGPSQPVTPPDSFFLAADLLQSAGVSDAAGFGQVATMDPNEYRGLVAAAGLKITRNNSTSAVGDAEFAWLTPTQGFAASNWIDTLVQRKLLSPAFVAAALAIDLEAPLFSERRKSLLAFIPDSLTIIPGEAHPDRLTREVIQRLQAANPPEGSAAFELLDLLTKPDPVSEVRSRVSAYRSRLAARLDRAASTRPAELQRLFALLIERRQAFLVHPLFRCLRESPALVPLSAPVAASCN